MTGIRRHGGIFGKLVVSYVIFLLLTVAAVVVAGIIGLVHLANGNPGHLLPGDIVDEDGEIRNLEILNRVGGWVEELDESLNVVKIYGNKKTTMMKYTMRDLAYLTPFMDEEDTLGTNYFAFHFSMDDRNGKDANSPEMQSQYEGYLQYRRATGKYYLVFYDTKVVSHTLTFDLDTLPDQSSGYFFMVPLMVLFVGNILVVSLYLKRKINKPITAITDGINRINRGERGVRINFQTEAEFEEIRNNFNRMSEQLENGKIEREKMIRDKNQLMMELSHDIKNPVATIKGCANALSENVVPEEKRQDYYRIIETKADRIQRLSEDMFLMLRMDSDQYKINKEKTDICEILRKICAEYYEEITDAGFVFEIDIPEQIIYSEIDCDQFSRVIGNLLDNGRKYNVTGNRIRVVLKQDERWLVIRVMDDGETLDCEIADTMFDAFARGDTARTTEGGTGLGLFISRRLIELHGGWLEYEHCKGWNCFVIKLNCK